MKPDRKNVSPSLDTHVGLREVERTMQASIALMKRLRRERRRALRSHTERAGEQQAAKL